MKDMKKHEMSDNDLENAAGGKAYGYGTNFYLTVQTAQSYLPLLEKPEKKQCK